MVVLQSVPLYHIPLASNTFYFLLITTDDPFAFFVLSTASETFRVLGWGFMRTKEVSRVLLRYDT